MSPKRIAVLVSGGGTNLQAVIDACESGDINGEVVLVVSNKEDAFGLERARKKGIRAEFVDPKKFIGESFDSEVLGIMEDEKVQLVVLAGYLRVLYPVFIERYRNRIVNIHPSLIPEFCGKGFYGEKVHRAVIQAGKKESGATVHIVDEGTDTGPILLQESVPVFPDDTAESLQKRVLEVEHRLLVKAISELCLQQDH